MSNQQKEDNDDDAAKETRDGEDKSADDKNGDDENDRPEGQGNLHRRSDWLQKRHGGS